MKLTFRQLFGFFSYCFFAPIFFYRSGFSKKTGRKALVRIAYFRKSDRLFGIRNSHEVRIRVKFPVKQFFYYKHHHIYKCTRTLYYTGHSKIKHSRPIL